MKMLIVSVAMGVRALLSQSTFAAEAAAAHTAQCKDGTYFDGATHKGACRGHQGVKEWLDGTAKKADAKADAKAVALEQLERVPVGDFLHAVRDVAVANGVLDAVRRRCVCDLDAEVVEEHLAVAALVVEHAVLSEHLEAVELDGDHPTAAATVSASTCSRTSWTRKIAAPRS